MRKTMWFMMVLVGVLGLVAQAEIIRSTDYGVGADTYVANDIGSLSPDANFGTENRMRLRNNSNNRLRVAYLRFDLQDVLTDPTGAYLMFETTWMKSGGKIVDVYGLTDESLDTWIESGAGGITFNTAPGLDPADPGQLVLDESRTTFLGTFQTSSEAAPVILTTNPLDLDLAGFIASKTNGLITLLMVGQDDETEIATKEHDTYMAPTLVLPDSNDIVARAYDPVPAPYTTVSPSLDVLTWTNPDPNNPGETITCDVYFGATEPNALLPNYGLDLLAAGVTGNSVALPPLEQFKTYYWMVNIHDSSFPDRTVPGFVWVFDTFNAAPVVNAGDDQYVWLNKAVVSTTSDADTYLRDDTPRGDLGFMDIRGASSWAFRGYLRFDLSSLSAMGPGEIENVSLTLTKVGGASRNDAVTNDRFALYGLNDVEGNTPQNWSEAGLIPDNAGAEWTFPLDLESGRLTNLDDTVEGITEIIDGDGGVGTTITVSGEALVNFLKSRIDDNGLVTFVIANPATNDRGYGLGTKENDDPDSRPLLTLTYTPDSAPNDGNAVVTLSAEATDDGLPDPPGAMTYKWTQVSGPDVEIDPDDVLETQVELSEVGYYVFQFEADDGQLSAADTVQIYVGYDACDAAQNMPDYTPIASDLNSDCYVDLLDFAILASEWLDCSSLDCP
ncbi:MAG TPA: hypothetical protein ENN97_05975 [Phycisphaerales bacterium]|nr:hypothetical protein [Phycisphaerales bacterium]